MEIKPKIKVRNIVIHTIILFGVIFLSFFSIFLYLYNSEARSAMELTNPEINIELLIKNSIITFFVILLDIYVAYFAYFNLLLKGKLKKRNLLIALCIFVSLAVFKFIFLQWFTYGKISFSVGKFLPYTVISLVVGGIGIGIRALVEYFNQKENKKELEKKNLESEINLLRSQINPHFLFNTLNNIDALIRKDPERASDLLIKLSTQMRYMLYDSNTHNIQLSSELEFINDYIDLQKLRFENENVVQLEIKGDVDNSFIPPMLFIPFIENAFKHCSNYDVDKAIDISIEVTDNLYLFKAKNLFEEKTEVSKDKTSGIGVQLTKRRLELLYPKMHKLEIKKEAGWYSLILKINKNGVLTNN